MPSLYLLVFGLVVICTIITVIKPNTDKVLYYICLGVMTIFLVFRFGQGTDYPGYLCIYETAGNVFLPDGSFIKYLNMIHTEIGWKLIMVLFKMFDADFWLITMLVAIVTMVATHFGIVRFCEKNRTMALVLLYPTIYLTYYFSGMRQGLVMAVFFGILLERVLKKKYISYVLGILILCTIHKASICYLIIPIILLFNKKCFVFGTILSIAAALGMVLEPVREVIKSIAVTFGVSGGYFGVVSISWFSLAERLVMLGIISVLVWECKEDKELIEKSTPLLKIYYFAFLIYICFLSNSFVASRLAIMFKMAEVMLIPMMLSHSKKARYIISTSILGICLAMTYKNLNSYAAGYYENISGYNYPYVTIFNQKDILQYREEFVNDDYDFIESDYLK